MSVCRGRSSPSEPGYLATHHVDAVERRMFEVLGQGEDMVLKASERIPINLASPSPQGSSLWSSSSDC